MKFISKKYFNTRIFVFIICLIGLFLAATTFFDLDFPWHVQYASDVLKYGVSYLDMYSYTMPSFPYVDHSLLSSIIFTLLYNVGGYGLVAFGISIVALAGITLISSNLIWLVPVIASTYFSGYGVRAHVFSFLFTAILFKFTKVFFNTKRNMFFSLPLFMCLWANLHGGFSLGIIYLWGHIVFDVFWFDRKQYRLSQKLQSILAVQIATLATLFTPYGIGTWEEAARTILSSDLRKYIVEWQPVKTLPSFGMLLIIIMFGISIYFTRKIRFREIFTIYLFVQGIFSIRFLPLFAISTAPTIVYAFNKYFKQNKNRIDPRRFSLALSVLTVVAVVIFAVEAVLQIRFRSIIMTDFYPTDTSLVYLSTNKPQQNIFTMANWGSYLNWKIPGTKSFLDGRMYVWSQQPREHELSNAFKTYEGIMDGSVDYKPVFNEFCISTVLWHTNNTTSGWYQPAVWAKFTNQIPIDGWIKVYKDSVTVIYERKLPPNCLPSND